MDTSRRPAASDGPSFELPDELAAEQLALRLGIEVVDWDPERLRATMPVAGNRQPFGLLHGGASAVLAETLGSLAAGLHADGRAGVVGMELSCSHLRPVRDGFVTGTCTPLHRGSRTATYSIEITDGGGRRTCVARLTCLIARKWERA